MRLSRRTLHITNIIVMNLVMTTALCYAMRHEWYETYDFSLLIKHFLIFITAMIFSTYSWVTLIRSILIPLDRIINTLYEEAQVPPHEEEGEYDGQPEQIHKLSHVLDIFRQNVRQAKITAEELRIQKFQIDAILAELIDVIVTIDVKGVIQMVSRSSEKMLGYTERELLGKNITVLMPESYRAIHAQQMNRYLETGDSHVIGRIRELEALHKTGSKVPVEISITEIDNDVMHVFVGLLHDISGRKKSEQEREKYLQALEVSNAALDDFAYIVSHDLKEPLRGVKGFSKFLMEDAADKLNEEGKNKLLTIYDLAQKLEDRMNALLHYSRLGKTELAIRETDLNEVIKEVLSTLPVHMGDVGASIVMRSKLPVIVCDHVRISDVFLNLISNALKFSDKKDNKIEIGYVTDHPQMPGETVFYVKDNGIGIDPKQHESLFKIFKRLHPEGAYGGGTGSGLAIVKKIITQHGGQIWVESKGEGQGAVFFFTIPQTKK